MHTNSNYEQNQLSDYAVNDVNITAYVPFFETHTLLFNAFQSRSNITTNGLVDESSLRAKYSLSCELEQQTDACNTAKQDE